MVKRFAGRSFALIGVNSDGPVEEAKKRILASDLPWRIVLDGSPGTVTRKWNVRSMPMLYILDARGVIRARGDLTDDALDRPVADMLDALAAGGK